MAGPIAFDIFVADGFVMTEFAGVVDVLRIANRITARDVFRWRFLSHKGGPVQSSSDATVQSVPLDHRPEADYFFVLGNTNPRSADLSLGKAIATYTARQARVVLLSEAASRYISETDRDASKHTTHWENKAVLRERHGLTETRSALVVDAGSIITGAGMGATIDLTLSIASQYVSSVAMMTVADVMLHEHIRHFNTLQPFGGRAALATGDLDLDGCLALMQEHIEFPLPISEVAAHTKLSKRSLERKFQRVLGTTPNGYYRELRLNKANNLLLNTEMKINEIGLACGFPSGFTTIYRETFGMTPNTARKKGRRK